MTRRLRPEVVAALLAACSLCACSGSPEPGAAPTSGATASRPPSASPGTTPAPGPQTLSPLTGLPVEEDVARAVTVAVPVQAGAGRTAPSGLRAADLAYVAFPGPERQRVVALYQSRTVDAVGPVAQTRPMDGKVVAVLDAVLQYGGGPASFVRQLQQAEVTEWSSLVHSEGFTRDASGLLYASPAAARDADGARAARVGVLPFARSAPTGDGGDGPDEVAVEVPSQPSLTLRFDAEEQAWDGTLGDVDVSATNVVLQEVEYEQLVLPQTGGATERDPVLLSASGPATVLRPSGVVTGSWNRRGRSTLTSYVGKDGVPVRLSPGTTRVLLVPEGTSVSTD